VVIDENQEIIQVRGLTGPYLELATGRANLNLLKMARAELSLSLRTAIHTARKENRRVTKESVPFHTSDKMSEIRLSVIPLKSPGVELHFLVLFEETTALPQIALPEAAQNAPGRNAGKQSLSTRRIAAMEQELAETKVEMATLLEERDAANEELHTANEEVRTSNIFFWNI
jgi:two-component system CheB/CheR fusion protein